MEGTRKQLLSVLVPWIVTSEKASIFGVAVHFFRIIKSERRQHEKRIRNDILVNHSYDARSDKDTWNRQGRTLVANAKKGDISSVIEQISVIIHKLSKVTRTHTNTTE
jgi:hypothetical protein